ncbi:MAG TPA: hypothetical protein VK948_04075 [Aeromicrobium sp.]|nr:hypothetical protein [Aeromicrobium sp.]
MDDYGSLVYLDVQKTGSTYVNQFLAASCTLPQRSFRKHGRIEGGTYRPEAHYFITARHPVPSYVSLFRFGLAQRGGIRRRLMRSGHEDLYQRGINAWLEFILDERNVNYLSAHERFDEVIHSGVGLMTFRFLALSIVDPMAILPSARSLADLGRIYAERNIARRVIRNEELNTGLATLALEDVPQWFDASAARAFLDTMAPINASIADRPGEIAPELLAEIQKREGLLIDWFYPDE